MKTWMLALESVVVEQILPFAVGTIRTGTEAVGW